jgi:hypothetical protein
MSELKLSPLKCDSIRATDQPDTAIAPGLRLAERRRFWLTMRSISLPAAARWKQQSARVRPGSPHHCRFGLDRDSQNDRLWNGSELAQAGPHQLGSVPALANDVAILRSMPMFSVKGQRQWPGSSPEERRHSRPPTPHIAPRCFSQGFRSYLSARRTQWPHRETRPVTHGLEID